MWRAAKVLLVLLIGTTPAGVTGCLATPAPRADDDAVDPPIDAPVAVDGAPVDGVPADPACPHRDRDVCVPGACIDVAAGGCAAEVCTVLPSCCNTAWTSACTKIASTTCATCEHAPVIGAHQHLFVTERAGGWPVLESLGFAREASRVRYRNIAVADHDSDGDADLAMAGDCDAAVVSTLTAAPGAIVLGAPTFIDLDDGVVGCPGSNQFAGSPVAWGDVDRDGDLDLAVGGMRGLGVLRQDQAGWMIDTLLATTDLVGEDVYYVEFVAWLDVDGDHWLDLLVGSGEALLLFRNTAGVLQRSDLWAGPRFIGRGDACDLDGDHDLDLVVVDENGYLSMFNAVGDAFAMAGQVVTDAVAVGCGDLDGDGRSELVSADDTLNSDPWVPGHVRIWRRGGPDDLFIEAWASQDTYLNEGAIALADDDGDGDLDVLFPDTDGAPDYAAGQWVHLLENTTAPGTDTFGFVDHPGRYLPAVPGIYSYGAAWLPLRAPR